MRLGQARHGLGPADPDRAAEHALHIIGDPLQFGAAAGQHDLAAERPGEAELLQRLLDLAVRCSSRWRITATSWARVMRGGSPPSSPAIGASSIMS